jgi:hypothetical protein
MTTRFPTPEPNPRRPSAFQFGEGAALVEPACGTAADFVRLGGLTCPVCGGDVGSTDWTQEGRSITMDCACECCEFRCQAEFRLIDAEV